MKAKFRFLLTASLTAAIGLLASSSRNSLSAQEAIRTAPLGSIPIKAAGEPASSAKSDTTYFPEDNGACDSRLQLSIGERTWFNWGESTWSVQLPPFLSDLKWRNLESTVYETNFDAVLNKRFIAHADVGYGGINSGHIDDADYLGADRSNLVALSRTIVSDDDMFYVNADFGFRVLCRENGCRKLTVDALAGYQYWREKYFSQDGNQLITNPPLVGVGPPPGPIPGAHLSELWERQSVRVGVRGNLTLGDKAAVNSRLMFIPWAHHEMTDDHLFPTGGVAQTYKNKADGGWGVNWDATVAYKIRGGLSAEAGYQIWYEDVQHGSTDTSGPRTAPATGSLKELETFRHGILLGLKWAF